MTTKIDQYDSNQIVKYLNLSVKLILVMSFVVAIFGGLENVVGKGMLLRAPLFLLPVWLVPLIAYLKKWKTYPHMGDFLIALPFLFDTLGNIFGLFEAFKYFDDVMHTINWIILIMAYHAFRFRKVQYNQDAVLLGTGVGAILIILWEILEWTVSVDGLGTLQALYLTYGDTIGDLFLSTLGGLIGSIIGVKLFGVKKVIS